MSSFSPADDNLHTADGRHRTRPPVADPRWNDRMEGHIRKHARQGPTDPVLWASGRHIPRQLRTPLAES